MVFKFHVANNLLKSFPAGVAFDLKSMYIVSGRGGQLIAYRSISLQYSIISMNQDCIIYDLLVVCTLPNPDLAVL